MTDKDKDGMQADQTWLEWFNQFNPSYDPKKEDSEYFKLKILCGICDALEDIKLELKKIVKDKKT